MSVMGPIKTISDGLVFYYDTNNVKSYAGEPTTNLINSVTNSYPKVGNAFETYNVNQYNGAQYFSIGTISSVISNQVTTATAHPLRTYDVVTPQTTAGGVTAGTNYYVKNTGTYTFTLHAYDASQDGSKGLSVLDPITNDTRISINSTSFPTMWWGPPHQPNSGLIKTIVPNGFNGHECMRLNFYRPDGVTDGMAYGVYISIKSSTTYSYSYSVKAADSNAVGKTMTWSLHWWGIGSGSGLTSAVLTTDWQRITSTVTTPAGSAGSTACYWFISSGPCAVDLAEIQYEEVSHVTPFVPTSRSSTQGLLDLVGNNTINLNSSSFDSSAQITFNGSNCVTVDDTATLKLSGDKSFLMWINMATDSSGCGFGGKSSGTLLGMSLGYGWGENGFMALAWNSANSPYLAKDASRDIGKWVLLAAVQNGSTRYIYAIDNGGTRSSSYSGGTHSWDNNLPLKIGRINDNAAMPSGTKIGPVSVYNRALSASEVLQNYNSAKSRFGL